MGDKKNKEFYDYFSKLKDGKNKASKDSLLEHHFDIEKKQKKEEGAYLTVIKNVMDQTVGASQINAKPASLHYKTIDGSPDAFRAEKDTFESFHKSQYLRATRIGLLAWL